MKIPVVKQHDLTDCGPACLLSIIKHYKGYVPLELIRLNCETGADGTNIYNLIKAAKKYNLSAKAIKIGSIDDLSNDYQVPSIIHMKLKNGLYHFMVLYEVKDKYLTLMDPAQGKIKLNKSDVKDLFTGIVILFYPVGEIENYNAPNSMLGTIFLYIKYNKIAFIKILVASLFSIIISSLSTYYIKYGSVISSGGFGLASLLFLMYSFISVGIIKVMLDYLKNSYLINISKNISTDVYEKFSRKLINLPLSFIKSKTTGEIISRFGELNEINDIIPTICLSSVIDLITAFIALIFALNISVKLTIFSLLIIFMYLVISIIYKNPTLNKINKNINEIENFNTKKIDEIKNIVSTKYLNAEEIMLDKSEKVTSNFLFNKIKFNNFFNNLNLIKNFIYEIGKLSIISYGLYLNYRGDLLIVDLFTFYMILNYLVEPLKEMIDILPKVIYLKTIILKLNEFNILEIKSEGIYEFSNGDIKINNLSFAYNDIDYIIKNISMEVKKGEKILLQGPSGCGKSTICQLINKILKVKEGEILINNQNINDIKESSIRKNITYIGQKDSLLIDSIINNIKFERNIEDKNIQTICKICEIDEIVKRKYDRYETILNESYMNISGGEKQRISLARGLLNESPIIVLDEALSEVNKDMEERIIKNIFKLYKDKTIIYVSHKTYKNIFDRTIKINS